MYTLNLWPIAEAVVNQTQNLSLALSISEEGPSCLQLFLGLPPAAIRYRLGTPIKIETDALMRKSYKHQN